MPVSGEKVSEALLSWLRMKFGRVGSPEAVLDA
jgi:hypothetical protein